ncbi:gamma-glutamyl kinase [Campylobacter blaseri]|uniref:Glutamate 5-kinase n=1 Tax=Campylobacter blaseri TaxID=2042961 RepID=A0A2P8QZC8_9BACT|nr:glutamate 5-kinase [Campylobacter blaseri]PSM51608.1 glutamate 5-kinase [Campylobacter blaseri]PSM53401.1 glutamate 5-kinase [Campylobacter blaseri]QKF86697.1 gamma-glutamyl kinase [Campylobacter blaseri]
MKRVVIKVGSHVLSDKDKISEERVGNLCSFLAKLMQKYEVILVSSGAISAGGHKVNIKKDSVVNRQILASVGQAYLMEIYSDIMVKYDISVAQILLTARDFDSRKATAHAKNLVDGLCKNKILPIINENDATAIEEIVFGDNDSLSANVAYYFNGDMLVILSDIDGYYDDNPNTNKNAKIRPLVPSLKKEELELKADAGSEFGTGGIVTKLKAANFLLNNNKSMFLTSGFDLKDAYSFLLDGKKIGGTLFKR